MFERIGRSWELVKASYAVLRSDKELVVYPVISFIGVILVTISFALPLAVSGFFETMGRSSQRGGGLNIASIMVAFLFYMVMYSVIFFCQSALVGAAMMRLRGEDPTLSDGFRIAQQRIGKILGYAAIAATVGLILQALSNSARNNRNPVGAIAAQIVISLIGMAWNIATFLVVPVLVVEDIGPIDAVKRSASLLKKTWGEQIVGNFSIGTIFGLLTLAVVLVGSLLIFIFASINAGALVVLAVILMVVAILGLSLLSSTLSGIYQAALYRYATDGDVGTYFSTDLIQGAFREKSGGIFG